MKNRTLIIIVTLFAFLMSCSDDFLDRPPLNEMTENNFWKTADDAVTAVTAAYDGLQIDGAYRWGFLMNGDVRSEDAASFDPGWYVKHDAFTVDASDPRVLDSWRAFYATIFRANSVINKVPAIKMDEQLKQRLINEAHFLRGVAYFNVVTIWGDAPLRLTAGIGSDLLNLPRSSKEEIWAQIEKDFTQAENLPNKGDAAAGEIGRATKGAAKAFLAKTYLYQNKWELAAAKAKEVMDLGIYDLNEFYGDNWNRQKENGIESIFEMQYSGGMGGWMTHEGNILGSWLAPAGAKRFYPGGGWSIVVPDTMHQKAYEEGDLRRKINIFVHGDVYEGANEGPQAYDSAWNKNTRLNIAKYIVVNPFDPTEKTADGHLNIPVMRYAEVLLIRAEALNEMGQTAEAEDLLNMVRNRAGLPDVEEGLSKQEFRERVLHERRIEFFAEGQYFFDEIRMLTKEELTQRMLASGKNNFDYDRDIYMPIPQLEIDLNNNLLPQNSGY